jgi:hypothetical protein
MPKLAFRPDADGLLFTNSFTWDAIERAAIAEMSLAIVPAVVALVAPDPIFATIVASVAATYLAIPSSPLPGYGLCGGMVYAALDHWHAHMPPPRGATTVDQPLRGTSGEPVRVMVWNRLMDSLTSGGVLSRTIEWMLRLNTVPGFFGGGAGWLNDRTAEEWEVLKRYIDQGQPWPIALVGDTLAAWSQHQILVYGYEDSGTTKVMYVYDPNDPHDYGTTADTRYEFSFSPTGLIDSLKPSGSSGIGMLKGFFCSNYARVIPPSGLAAIFGEFVNISGGAQVWLMRDGERFPVVSPQELSQLGGSFTGVRTRIPFNTSAASWPRDDSILREVSAAEVYIIQGGARFHIPDPATMELFGGFGLVRLVPDGLLAQFNRLPITGTLLREISDAKVYRIENGTKRWILTPAALSPLGGFPTVRLVPDGALAGIPDGPTIPPPLRQLSARVSPSPVTLNTPVSIRVTAVDSITQGPVNGRVLINSFSATGQPVHIQFATNTQTVVTLYRRREVTADDTLYVYPEGVVSATGYQSVQLYMGFPT